MKKKVLSGSCSGTPADSSGLFVSGALRFTRARDYGTLPDDDRRIHFASRTCSDVVTGVDKLVLAPDPDPDSLLEQQTTASLLRGLLVRKRRRTWAAGLSVYVFFFFDSSPKL